MKIQIYFKKSEEDTASRAHRLLTIVFPSRLIEVELINVPEKKVEV